MRRMRTGPLLQLCGAESVAAANPVPLRRRLVHSREMKFKATLFVLALALCVFALAAERGAPMPVYKVDPFWPKPLPNKWLIQGVPTMVTDKDDHIWVLNRPRDIMPDEAG